MNGGGNVEKKGTRYSDIIELPHHQSEYRPHMPRSSRAAQFAPFAALAGYEDKVQFTAEAHSFQGRKMLDENEKELLDRKLGYIREHLADHVEIEITYFDATANRSGGEYVSCVGIVKKIDECPFVVILRDGKKIKGTDIININGIKTI